MPLVVLALVCVGLGAMILAGGAAADSGNLTTFTLFDCTGPVGTPSAFTAVKQSLNGGSLHIVGTNESFDRQGELDLVTGVGFGPPNGLVSSGLMVTCEDVSPYTGDLGLIYGKIAQSSP